MEQHTEIKRPSEQMIQTTATTLLEKKAQSVEAYEEAKSDIEAMSSGASIGDLREGLYKGWTNEDFAGLLSHLD